MWSSQHSTCTLVLVTCGFLTFQVEPLFVAHRNSILYIGPNSSSVVVSADSAVVAFDVHMSWGQLFWATESFIYRTPLYDVNTTTVVAVTGRVSGGGLALDWIHRMIYWTDVSKGRVEVAHLDGKFRRVVCETNWKLGALVLDPLVGKLFWIESTYFGTQLLTRIKSSDTDGSHVDVLVTYDNIYSPGPLTIDLEHSSLYFYRVNRSVGEQWELSYGGLGPQMGVRLFDQTEGPARSLALTHGGFYFSNKNGLFLGRWKTKSYSVVNRNMTNIFVLLEPYFTPVDEKMVDASQIRVMINTTQPRAQDERGAYRCQHESTGPQAYRCVCRYGFSLMEDQKSCFEKGYVLYSTSNTFRRITLDGKQPMILFNDPTVNIQTFDTHIGSGYLYWADMYSEAIYRSPVDTPVRRMAFVQNTTAFGLAVDWIHNHVYWSELSRIMVASLDGENKMAILKDLDSPADVAVDPINRNLFWMECGINISLKMSDLAGNDISSLTDEVTCGSTITLDIQSRTVYWLDLTGTVYSCDYDGDNYKELYITLASGIAINNGQLMVIPITQEESFIPEGETFFISDLDIKPIAVRIVKSIQQPAALSSCEEFDCEGLCIPSGKLAVPMCLCPGEELTAKNCSSKKKTAKPKGLLEFVSVTPFSVTLQCAGPVLNYPIQQPALQVAEVSSLVNRPLTPPWFIRVANKSVPFTIDSLNPATSYSIMLTNRVTRSSFSLAVHTPPPPLRVDRVPLIRLVGPTPAPAWLSQEVHYLDPNPWQDLVSRDYILLLISNEEYRQTEIYYIDEATTKLINEKVKDNYVVLKHYKTKEEFDDDPIYNLGNIPWGQEFWLAMVQVTEYKGAQHLDFVFSEKFALPDPTWINLMEDILENNKEFMVERIRD